MADSDPILEGMSLLASANEVAEAVEMDLGLSPPGEGGVEPGRERSRGRKEEN